MITLFSDRENHKKSLLSINKEKSKKRETNGKISPLCHETCRKHLILRGDRFEVSFIILVCDKIFSYTARITAIVYIVFKPEILKSLITGEIRLG